MQQTELQVAVQHLRSLLPASCTDAELFCSTLQSMLALRLSTSWHTEDPERGSALRAVIWHEHAGGEGYDTALLSACRAVKLEPSSIAPFTLWVDPGCVAVSKGVGPGVSLPTAADQTFASSFTHSAGLKVLYGSLPLSLREQRAANLSLPQLSVSPCTPAMSRTALQQSQPLWGLPLSRGAVRIVDAEAAQASLSLLNAHAASFAEKLGLSRSSSLSSCYRSSTASDHCPSLVAGSTTGADSCDGEESASEISLEDQHGYGIVDLIEQVNVEEFAERTLQANDDQGDTTVDTVVASRATRFSTPVKQRPTAPPPPTGSVTPARKAAPTPLRSTPNYTVHDGGNVGVLGGGVKLGGASPCKSPVRSSPAGTQLWHGMGSRRSSATTFAQMYGSASVSGGVSAPLLAPHSAPVRTVQLPSAATYFTNANPFAYMHPQQVQQAVGLGVEGHMAPPPFHMQHHAAATVVAHQQLGAPLLTGTAGLSPHAFLSMDPNALMSVGGKRVRSRGRRSRGRGAGRAARRAAAIKAAAADGHASGAGSLDDGSDLDDDDEEDEEEERLNTSVLGLTLTAPTKPQQQQQQSLVKDPVLMREVQERADVVARNVAARRVQKQHFAPLGIYQRQRHVVGPAY